MITDADRKQNRIAIIASSVLIHTLDFPYISTYTNSTNCSEFQIGNEAEKRCAQLNIKNIHSELGKGKLLNVIFEVEVSWRLIKFCF